MAKRSVIIVRHGSTQLNQGSHDKIRGWVDVPLSEQGYKDAQRAADKLKNSGIKTICCSDLQRARDTASAIAKTTRAKVIPMKGLRTWDVGAMNGKDSRSTLPELEKYATQTPDKPVPKGESFNSFKSRAMAGVHQAMMQNPGNLAIVTHHRVERLLDAWDKKGQPTNHGVDLGSFLQKGEPPGGIRKVALDTDALGGGGATSTGYHRAEKEKGAGE